MTPAIKPQEGRALDALVAQELTGWTPDVKSFAMDMPPEEMWTQPPHYSTSMSDAWLLVKELRLDWVFSLRDNGLDGTWTARFESLEAGAAPGVAEAETAPLAICLAALATRGITFGEE